MAMGSRLLSKSRFKLACECPTKLYFTGKKEFENTKLDDAFLKALAEGGFQVGELAKRYHPGGTEIETLDSELALQKTNELLQQENVVIYEPAFRFNNLLVRIDILVKRGNSVELIEVKAKSFDRTDSDQFYNKILLKKGISQLTKDWEPYLLDVAFQKYVLKGSCPSFNVTASLMLADKQSRTTVEGLNQLFLISQENGRIKVHAPSEKIELGSKVLTSVCVDTEIDLITQSSFLDGMSFENYIQFLSEAYSKDAMIPPSIGSQCKSCEFKTNVQSAPSKKSGFETCWSAATGLTAQDLSKPKVFEIWNYRKSDKQIKERRYFIADIGEEDISPKESEDAGLSQSERQWMQVVKVQQSDNSAFVDHEGLANEMDSWEFPLHFIDFETSLVAIPFHRNRRPYEMIAFQFSHHVVKSDGSIEHKSQYISSERGIFPNFQFVRELRKCLSEDNGAIFRYGSHENTVLCQIHRQLADSTEADREALMAWIETITKSTGDSVRKWEGKRLMIDLCELVKKFFYHPHTKGSNSIKKVLPAILATSSYIQNRYSKPIYGSDTIKSHNFKGWKWIEIDAEGAVKDPYSLLPSVYENIDSELLDTLVEDDTLADGGAAMTAFARMQFTQMTEQEFNHLSAALLKYCELDTFAMVLIYEYWRHAIDSSKKKVA